jgi:hypothetical protein
VNSVDLSDHVRKVTLHIKSDELDSTAMGATYHARAGGLNDWSIAIDFNQDFAAAKVDATIFPLLGTTTTVTAKATSAANAATNPQYSGSVLVADYSPLDGSVGDLATSSVSWNGAGTLSRLTS